MHYHVEPNAERTKRDRHPWLNVKQPLPRGKHDTLRERQTCCPLGWTSSRKKEHGCGIMTHWFPLEWLLLLDTIHGMHSPTCRNHVNSATSPPEQAHTPPKQTTTRDKLSPTLHQTAIPAGKAPHEPPTSSHDQTPPKIPIPDLRFQQGQTNSRQVPTMLLVAIAPLNTTK